jgi:hypothetical protein
VTKSVRAGDKIAGVPGRVMGLPSTRDAHKF